MAMNLEETDKTIAAFREEVNRLLKAGREPKEAVNEAYKKYPVMKVMQDELGDQLVAEAKRGGASKSIPHETLKKAMLSSWAPDGLTLSKRTTNGSEYVRAAVAKAIQDTIKEGKSIREATEKLFDGYNYGGIIPEQQIPEFMEKLTKLVNPKDYGGQAFKSTLRAAKRNISKLSARGLKAAYKSIITAVEAGNEKKVEKAVWVATQERTRFFARRIARTEMARAYGDGFWSKYAADDDVAAFQWKTSTGHPFEDICDLYAHADLYGLGPGIFPKDKVPELPAHPNCMCRLVPVYAGSLKLKREKPVDRVEEGGMEYIAKLSPHQREMLLGVNGAGEVEKGASWIHYAKGFFKKFMTGRIKNAKMEAAKFNLIQGAHSYQEDLAAVNPNYATHAPEWTQNCQRCVSTYEARRRGYDVEALPCILDGTDRMPYMADKVEGWTSVYQSPQLINCSSNSGINTGKKVRKLMGQYGDGARAIVRVQWKQGGGHVFIAEQREGKTFFLDPQAGTESVDWYFEYAKRDKTYLLRIDNLTFTDHINKCCTNRK